MTYTYLIITWNKKDFRTKASYINVIKAQLYELTKKFYPLGNLGFVFNSPLTYGEIESILKMRREVPYMLIEITDNILDGKIKGFIPETEIENLREITKKTLSLNMNKILDKINKTGIDSISR